VEDEVAALIRLLDVEQAEPDLWRGGRYHRGRGRVFGGQVIGQALVAASRSVAERQQAHSLHAYFMRPGDEEQPIDYRVLRDFDGRSFATRRIVALQGETPILNLTASFQRPETGLEHGIPLPDVLSAEALERSDDSGGGSPLMAHFLKRFRAFEFRPVPPFGELAPAAQPGPSYLWFRLAGSAPADPAMRSAILAYLSDFGLLTTRFCRMAFPYSAASCRWRASTIAYGCTSRLPSINGCFSRWKAPGPAADVASRAAPSTTRTAAISPASHRKG